MRAELKSQDPRYQILDLAINLAKDCSLSDKDIDTLTRRYWSEGLPFFTEVLPKLAKALTQGVRDGYFLCPEGFKPYKKGALPAFLHELLLGVFELDGKYRANPCQESFFFIYQFCSFFYKVDLPYSDEKNDAVIASFLETEEELKGESLKFDENIVEIAANQIAMIFNDFSYDDITPKHGPGATANRAIIRKWTDNLDPYPVVHALPLLFFFNYHHMVDEIDRYPLGREPIEQVAEVVLVPKDSRGPRLISKEPAEVQYIQQGIFGYMREKLESHPYTRGEVNFTSQQVNKDMAKTASITNQWVTMDLKDASDRVSLKLVRRIFAKAPELLNALELTRSTSTIVGGNKVALSKFAPMGSACCFPVMATCIWALIKSSIYQETGSWDSPVYVYGDDIIIPLDHYWLAAETLHRHGLRLNVSKTFPGSDFAESCGGDFFMGEDVTPVRLRQFYGTCSDFRDKAFSDVDVSLIETANLLRKQGCVKSAMFIKKIVERRMGPIAFGYPHSPFICFHRDVWGKDAEGVNPRRYWIQKPVDTLNEDETGWSFLHRTHLMIGSSRSREYGVYNLPRQSVYRLISGASAKSADSPYPACTWLPTCTLATL